MANEVTIDVTIKDTRLDSELAGVRAKIDAAFKGMGKDIPIGFDVNGMSKLTQTLHNNFDMISHDLVLIRQGMGNLGTATGEMASKVDKNVTFAGNRWRWFGMTFFGAARTVITGAGEIAAILVPATLAAGVGAFVLYQGAVENTGRHLQALYGTMEAQGQMFHKTSGDVLGLGHSFQKAQDMANPRAYQLLGTALELDRSHFMNLSNMGLQVTDVLDRLSARIRVDMQASSGQIGALRSKAVPDLIGVGQVFGNLTHAIFSFAGKMPGVAEMLLNVVNTGAKLLNWFASLPTPIVKTALGLEAAHRWGGLLANNVLGPLTGKLGAFSDKIGMSSKITNSFGKAAKFLQGSWGWVVPAAAVIGVLFVNALEHSKDATEAWISSTSQMLGAAKNVNVLNDILKVTPQNAQRLSSATKTLSTDMQNSHQVAGVLSNRIGQYSGVTERAAGDVYKLTTQQKALRSETGNVLQGAALIEKAYGTTFVGALVLADQANVKLKNSMKGNSLAARENRLQIADLVAGYQAMAQPMGAIGKDMDALGIQTELQGTKVGQLNQAWDTWMQSLTNGTNVLAQMQDAVRNLKNDAQGSASAFTGVQHSIGGAADKIKFSLSGMGKISSQSWQQFDQVVGTTAPQLIDWLRTAGAEGVLSQHNFTRAIQGTISQLLPFAAHSKTATAELDALAQQAGGPTTSNFRVLQKWVDSGHVSMNDLKNIIDQTTIKMGNMGQVAQNLGAVVNTDIIQTMGKAKEQFYGVNKAVTDYTNSLHGNWSESDKTKAAYNHLVDVLTRVVGSHKEAIRIADAYTRSLGGTQKQIDAMHGKTVDVTVHGDASGKLTFAGQALGQNKQGFLEFHAAGGMVGGIGNGTSDSNIIAASKGEFVINADSTAKHLPLLEAINAKKMATGGLVGMNSTIGRMDSGMPNAMTALESSWMHVAERGWATSAEKALKHVMQSFTGPAGGPGGGAPSANAALARRMYPPWASGAEWAAWNAVAMRESGWSQFAYNPSGAFGIPQALPFTKMPHAAWPTWAGGQANPMAQIGWMIGYIKSTYGDPLGAWQSEVSRGWYGNGLKGGIFTKPTLIGVGERGAERVDITPLGGRGGGSTVRVIIDVRGGDRQFSDMIKKWVRVDGGGDVQSAFGTRS